MKIELSEATDAEALGGTPELWMRVLSDELVDLPRALAALSDEDRATFSRYFRQPDAYYPALGLEGDDHGYAHESWWIFKKMGA